MKKARTGHWKASELTSPLHQLKAKLRPSSPILAYMDKSGGVHLVSSSVGEKAKKKLGWLEISRDIAFTILEKRYEKKKQ